MGTKRKMEIVIYWPKIKSERKFELRKSMIEAKPIGL